MAYEHAQKSNDLPPYPIRNGKTFGILLSGVASNVKGGTRGAGCACRGLRLVERGGALWPENGCGIVGRVPAGGGDWPLGGLVARGTRGRRRAGTDTPTDAHRASLWLPELPRPTRDASQPHCTTQEARPTAKASGNARKGRTGFIVCPWNSLLWRYDLCDCPDRQLDEYM